MQGVWPETTKYSCRTVSPSRSQDERQFTSASAVRSGEITSRNLLTPVQYLVTASRLVAAGQPVGAAVTMFGRQGAYTRCAVLYAQALQKETPGRNVRTLELKPLCILTN